MNNKIRRGSFPKMSTVARVPAVATVLAAAMTATPPVWAMESTSFAGDEEEARPVVSVRVEDSDPDEGVCTGTAIAPHWVITARHCVEAARRPGGSVRTGQGEQQRVYKVDRFEVAPRGDIALLHTAEAMQLDTFADIADQVPSGQVNIYGWSSDGSGGSQTLPAATGMIEGDSELALFDAPSALHVTLENQARIQPGDSGGAIFSDGKVAGIMSAGLFEDPDNPTEEEMLSNSAVATAPVADQSDWIRDTITQPETAANGTERNPLSPKMWMIAGAAAAVVLALVAVSRFAPRSTQRSRAKEQ